MLSAAVIFGRQYLSVPGKFSIQISLLNNHLELVPVLRIRVEVKVPGKNVGEIERELVLFALRLQSR